MRIGIRTKQVAGVMAIVGLAIAVLGGWYLASLTHILLDGSRSRARLLTNVIYERTFTVLSNGGDPVTALQKTMACARCWRRTLYAEGMVYAAIVDPNGYILATRTARASARRSTPWAA